MQSNRELYREITSEITRTPILTSILNLTAVNGGRHSPVHTLRGLIGEMVTCLAF